MENTICIVICEGKKMNEQPFQKSDIVSQLLPEMNHTQTHKNTHPYHAKNTTNEITQIYSAIWIKYCQYYYMNGIYSSINVNACYSFVH